jgi:hypothetical protein
MNDTKNGQKSFQKGVFICEGEIENHFVQEVFPSYKVVKTPTQTPFYMTFRILLCRLEPTREHWCKSRKKNLHEPVRPPSCNAFFATISPHFISLPVKEKKLNAAR